jgi:KaiC/GvpD/RAD55 family RecA-like ATPase
MDENLQCNEQVMSNERIQTGIFGLDDLIQGGFPKGSFVVVSGTPGSGKSIVGMQYLWQGLLSAEKCLYISVEQKKDKILRQAHQFGWDFESYEANGQLTIITLRSHELYEMQKINDLRRFIVDNHFTRVVLDSISSFTNSPIASRIIADSKGSGMQPVSFLEMCRAHVFELIDALQDDNVTVIGIAQKIEGCPGDTTDNISEFRADGLIVLDASSVGKTTSRTIQVKKMRQTRIELTQHNFDFTDNGVVVK